MSTIHPRQLFVATVAGWVNRHQHDIIDYLVDENRVLKGQLRGRRLRLSDEERRRLAVKGKALDGATLNLLEALELRKATATEVEEFASKLPAAAYKRFIYKEDRDIVQEPDEDYTTVRQELETKRLAFRAPNRALRKTAFTVTVDFRDEATG